MDNLNLAPVFARNCEVRRIGKSQAADFLNSYHRMGDATSRYRYGLFVSRHTGESESEMPADTMVAVATFSNARRWKKGDAVISSYEWIRYASLPDIRVLGGMGKLLDAFIEDVGPDDVMTYCDLRWSRGDAYRSLGFVEEGTVSRPGFDCIKFRRIVRRPERGC